VSATVDIHSSDVPCTQVGICRGEAGELPPSLDLTFPPTGLSENLGGRGEKGEREGWRDHLPYSPPLASASNTTLHVRNREAVNSSAKVVVPLEIIMRASETRLVFRNTTPDPQDQDQDHSVQDDQVQD